MKTFENSEWIWLSDQSIDDEYGEFFVNIPPSAESAVCRISCDGDYTLFIDGEYVSSNQYGDFEHYKIYDELNLGASERTRKMLVLVWHHGRDTQRYRRAKAGVIFEVLAGENLLASSGRETQCRRSPVYRSGYEKEITSQLGFSFLYDATKENSDIPCHLATVIDKTCEFYPRPIKRHLLIDDAAPTVILREPQRVIVDLGREIVGLCSLHLSSDNVQTVTVSFGEHLTCGGAVPRKISYRDFSFEYIARVGEQKYTNYMLRLGCRYLEITSEAPITLHNATVISQTYPVAERKSVLSDELDRRIYDACVETLRCCMMEHYVDCPWREQCLYVFDSRNQMLCGYYAFEDGNREYVRANHKLIAADRRSDRLLSICYPCGVELAIPSFSLYWFRSVREYLEHTGDVATVRELYPKLISVISEFVDNRRDGLVCKFGGKNNWNFYDWSERLEGRLRSEEAPEPDLMINCLFIDALENLKTICRVINESFAYDGILKETKTKTAHRFFRPESGLFSLDGGEFYHSLPNAFAVLLGLVEGDRAAYICERLVSGELADCSLSMKTFIYDALLSVDREKYRDFVLGDIRRNYEKMVEGDSGCVWETIGGAEDFKGAGSLCHGWSAIPIYFYHKLGVATYL